MEILTQLWLLWICLQHCLKVIPRECIWDPTFWVAVLWLLHLASLESVWGLANTDDISQQVPFCKESFAHTAQFGAQITSSSVHPSEICGAIFFITAGSEIRPWQFWEVDDASISLRLLFRPPLFPPICSFLPRPPRTWDELQKYAKPSPGWSYASVYSFPSSTIHLGMCVELLFTACNRLVVQ